MRVRVFLGDKCCCFCSVSISLIRQSRWLMDNDDLNHLVVFAITWCCVDRGSHSKQKMTYSQDQNTAHAMMSIDKNSQWLVTRHDPPISMDATLRFACFTQGTKICDGTFAGPSKTTVFRFLNNIFLLINYCYHFPLSMTTKKQLLLHHHLHHFHHHHQ